MNATRWNRREVLGGVLAAGASSAVPFRPSFGQQPVDTMTDRSELLIRNAYVLTMDAAGDLAGADVHVRDGAIAAVGRGLSAPGAQIIDGAGMLVLPGFVETHWHLWWRTGTSIAGRRGSAWERVRFMAWRRPAISRNGRDMACFSWQPCIESVPAVATNHTDNC